MRRAVEDDLAGGHADQAVAVFRRDIEMVQIADDGDAVLAVDPEQRVHHDLGVARIERGDRLVGQDDAAAPAPARARWRRAAAGRPTGSRRAGRGRWPMSSRSSAAMARILSSCEKLLTSVSAGGAMVEAAEQHVGQHVEAADQIELLEDHRRVAAPGAQAGALQRGDVAVAARRCGLRWGRRGG